MINKLLVFSLLILLSNMANAKYSRKEWKHWSDFNHNCINTRGEVLIERSLEPVTFTNFKKCTVKSGKWEDFYYNETIVNAKDTDIDHVVPLKHADDLVGEVWSEEKKEQFANDPLNLVITNKHYNRQKGSKKITEWLPVEKKYACRYIKRWVQVKTKYHLFISDSEKKVIDILGRCD